MFVMWSYEAEQRISKTLEHLFPINRSITGNGVDETLSYIKSEFFPDATIKSIRSGTKVFDWTIPPSWEVNDAFVLNASHEKIIDFKLNNLHLMSYSAPIDEIVSADKLLEHLHTLPDYPNRIPYRTSYYEKNWGFCCAHQLIESEKFQGPFRVVVDSSFNETGELKWLEFEKVGETKDEILISTYCCHPSLANDNLSGIVLACFLLEFIMNQSTKFTYRLIIIPETIGALAFLSQANLNRVVGGMVLSCVAGPDQFSIKEGFESSHFVNQAAHLALQNYVGKKYTTYDFVPDGSDERQFSSPGIKIVTPSIHKSKYYEFDEYHTSADNLDFISVSSLLESLEVHKKWVSFIESYCFPKRKQMCGEFQLGKLGLYPNIGATLNQKAHHENREGFWRRGFYFNNETELTGAHLEAFHWLMHLADGSRSNFEIAEKSGIEITVVNEAIGAFYKKKLLEL